MGTFVFILIAVVVVAGAGVIIAPRVMAIIDKIKQVFVK